MTDPRTLSLAELASTLRAGKLGAVELAKAAFAHDGLGAYRETDWDATRRHAEAAAAALRAGNDLGPLCGIPVSIKDLFGVSGYRTFAGCPTALPKRFEAPGPMVQAVTSQLGVVTGKTHTVQFAFGGVGTNPHHPTPINPWDGADHRAPGGSSAGAGVSLCEGSAWLALGTDTAGSSRIPAAWTGNVGLKPTKGRWSTAGIVPLSPTLDVPGLLARSVEDLVAVWGWFDRAAGSASAVEALEEPGQRLALAELRLGRCDQLLFEDCSPGVVEAVEDAVAELTRAGAHLEAVALPELRPTWELFRLGGPVSMELHHFLCTELPERIAELDPNVRRRIGDAAKLPAYEYLERQRLIRKRAAAIDAALHAVDVLVCPTVPNTPPRLADIATAEQYAPQNLLSLRNTCMANYLGLCALTMPVGRDAAGMPVGLQLFARGGADRRLLAVARCFEKQLGTGRERLGVPPRH